MERRFGKVLTDRAFYDIMKLASCEVNFTSRQSSRSEQASGSFQTGMEV